MKLIFATNNINKLIEVQKKIEKNIKLITLKEIGCTEDIPETSDTIEGNAIQKAEYIWKKYNVDCFSDDTGLCINSLNGEPGVFSARYAGEQKKSKDNINKVLENLKNNNDRSAFFQTSIALIIQGSLSVFNGRIEGQILKQETGRGGFGYDSIFLPKGYDFTFAQMNIIEKNKISHRGIAVKKLINHLENL